MDPRRSWFCSAPSRWSCAPSRRCEEVLFCMYVLRIMRLMCCWTALCLELLFTLWKMRNINEMYYCCPSPSFLSWSFHPNVTLTLSESSESSSVASSVVIIINDEDQNCSRAGLGELLDQWKIWNQSTADVLKEDQTYRKLDTKVFFFFLVLWLFIKEDRTMWKFRLLSSSSCKQTNKLYISRQTADV